jgi:hypothetical protein
VEAPSQAEEALRNEKAAGRKVGSKLNDKAVKRARERPNIVDFRKRTGRMKSSAWPVGGGRNGNP